MIAKIMNDLARRKFSSLSSSPSMTEADLIIIRTGLKRRGREYFKDQATKESQINLLLPWPVPPFQHQLLGHRGGCAGQGVPLPLQMQS